MSDPTPAEAVPEAPGPEDESLGGGHLPGVPSDSHSERLQERLLDAVQSVANEIRYLRFEREPPGASYEPQAYGLRVEIRLRADWPNGKARSVRKVDVREEPSFRSLLLGETPASDCESRMEEVGEKLQFFAVSLLSGDHVLVLPADLYTECPTCKGAPPGQDSLCSHCRGVGLVPREKVLIPISSASLVSGGKRVPAGQVFDGLSDAARHNAGDPPE